MNWFDEALHSRALDQGYTQRFEVRAVLCRSKTGFQDLLIFDTPAFGRVLVLDGIVQTTERDEFIYHEMLAHVPLLAHGHAARVLIVGGGDGGVLREVLRHGVERVTMVEIDPTVIALSREHLPGLSAGAFDDPRANLVIADGARFVAGTDESFDVVIVDSTDPVGPGEALFGEAFYAACRRCLAPGGVLVTQNGVPFLQPDEVTLAYRRLTPLFADVHFYAVPVPTYIGGLMTLGWATDDRALRTVAESVIAERFDAARIETRYYTPAVHVAAFALPGYVRALMA